VSHNTERPLASYTEAIRRAEEAGDKAKARRLLKLMTEEANRRLAKGSNV
jgi:uncharacterized protein HemY